MSQPSSPSPSDQHEVIGADMLAVRRAVEFLSSSASTKTTSMYVRNVLGNALTERLDAIDPERWYPVSVMLEMERALDDKIGASGLRRMGRALFKHDLSEMTRTHMKSVRESLSALDAMYRTHNRGANLGGWTVRSFTETRAELVKTTPHNCLMEEGILIEACATFDIAVVVAQPECVRNGDDHCLYIVTPTTLLSSKWGA